MLPFDPPTYTVSALSTEIRDFLKEAFRSLWIQGEVQRAKESQRGHFYFELIEKGDGDRIVARIDCVIWSRDWQRICRKLGSEPILVEGREVRCFGQIDFYVVGGRLQLVVRDVDPEFTLGRLALRRRETLAALEAAGLMQRNRSLPLSEIPLRIGLVTSKGSAAYHDFLGSLGESAYGFRVLFVHAVVQGKEAEKEITSALALLSGQDLDALVLTRGGGAKSDLAAFDARSISEAVARAPFPVLTGLGHEIDQSITDLVAHSALRTPTKAAEFLVERVTVAESRWLEIAESTSRVARSRLDREQSRLSAVEGRLQLVGSRLRFASQRLSTLARALSSASLRALRSGDIAQIASRSRLAASATFRLVAAREARRQRGLRLAGAAQARLRTIGVHLDGVARLSVQLSPQRTLERGFSITRDEHGRLLRDCEKVQAGERIRTQLTDGEITSRVESP